MSASMPPSPAATDSRAAAPVTLSEFPKFRQFPFEVRAMIWKYAMPGARVVEIYWVEAEAEAATEEDGAGGRGQLTTTLDLYDGREDDDGGCLDRLPTNDPDYKDLLYRWGWLIHKPVSAVYKFAARSIVPSVLQVNQESRHVVQKEYAKKQADFEPRYFLENMYIDPEIDTFFFKRIDILHIFLQLATPEARSRVKWLACEWHLLKVPHIIRSEILPNVSHLTVFLPNNLRLWVDYFHGYRNRRAAFREALHRLKIWLHEELPFHLQIVPRARGFEAVIGWVVCDIPRVLRRSPILSRTHDNRYTSTRTVWMANSLGLW